MQAAYEETLRLLSGYVPNLLGALAILVVGWLVAMVISIVVRGLLKKTTLDNRLAGWIAGEEQAKALPVEEWIAKAVYYLVMLVVLVAFFQALGLTLVTQPLNQLLTQLFDFVPRLLGAGLLLLIAWAVATVFRMVITRVLTAADLDRRLGGQMGLEGEPQVSVTKTLAEAMYWVVFLMFLPGVLGALALHGLLAPVEGMLSKVLEFLPNIFTAMVILGIGWLIARMVQRVVTGLLAAAGAERFSERVGLAPALGKNTLAHTLGWVVHILILVPVLIASLDALALESITRPASNMLNQLFLALPALFGATLLILIAYVVGRVVSGLVTNLLTVAGFNRLLARLGLGKEPAEDETRTPSAYVGTLLLVAVLLFGAIEAARMLNFLVLADLITRFLTFGGQVLLGLVIFGLGLYLANLASQTVLVSGAKQARVLALAARVSILVLAGAMALRQIGVANEIITLAFGLLLGSIAVATAIAMGLGGREVAARWLNDWEKTMRS